LPGVFDDVLNFWDENNYGEAIGLIDQGDGLCERVYRIPGGRSVDEHPRYAMAVKT
jgi:3-phenylpropionate/cinnamic acid dioxygenase small subunit